MSTFMIQVGWTWVAYEPTEYELIEHTRAVCWNMADVAQEYGRKR